MNKIYYSKAAQNVAGETVSIEPDGRVWADSDHRDIDQNEIAAEYDRIVAQETATRAAAIAHAQSLGFTDEMIAIMYPNLGGNNE